ncbi:19214_t:CDS:2 [Gigaspora rosea]|nr:19214_t:CDS:2 [Gigaspora rosea]
MLKSGTERGMTGNGKADEKNDFNIDNVKNNNEVFYYSRKSVRNACDDPEDGNNREKASDGRARIVSNEMGNGNKKGGNNIRNSVDKLEYNGIKGKKMKAKNDVDEGVTKRAEDDYANSKRKISVSKACEHRVMQTKARKRKEHRRTLT